MVWGKTSDPDEHRDRSLRLTGAVYDRRGRSGAELMRRVAEGAGSRGGAPIWVLNEAFVPAYEGPRRIPHVSDERAQGDRDGFAVFGRYPKGFLDHVIRRQLLGNIHRADILHVCSGTLSETERWTVDLRAEARPRVQADGVALPFRGQSFGAVMLDPPYSDQYARNLYGIENPRPAWLLKEAARVVKSSGRIGILHVAVPFAPPGCKLVKVYGVSTGVGFRIRAFTVYQRDQDELFHRSAATVRVKAEPGAE